MENNKTVFKLGFFVVAIVVVSIWSINIYCDVLSGRTDVTVGLGPSGIAIDTNYIWVANSTSNSVTRINKSDLSTKNISVGLGPTRIAVDENYVWVTNYDDDAVTRIFKKDLSKTTISVGVEPEGIAVDNNYVWVACNGNASGRVTRINKSDLSTTNVSVGGYATDIVVDDNYVWVTRGFGWNMARIKKSDLKSYEILPVYVGSDYGMVDDSEYVWVNTSYWDGIITRIRKSDLNTTEINVGVYPEGIAGNNDYIWVMGSSLDDKFVRISKSDLSVSQFTLDRDARFISVDGDYLWLSHYNWLSPGNESTVSRLKCTNNPTASEQTTWYLAEGATLGSFDEWVLVQNPNSISADCRVTFMKPDGSTVVQDVTVPATGRSTIHVNDHVSNESVSTMVESTNGVGIIAERAMYWDSFMEYEGYLFVTVWTDGHCSVGVTSPATTWYLAEGATLGSFDEWVLIMNPNASAADCRVTFMKPDGSTVIRYISVPATGRYTIHVNDHVPNESVSTMVESTNGVGCK